MKLAKTLFYTAEALVILAITLPVLAFTALFGVYPDAKKGKK